MPAPVAPESRDFEFEATLEDLENRVEAIRAQTQALGLFQDDVMAEIIPVTSPTTPAAPSEVYALGFATEIGVAWQFAKVVGSRRFGVEVRRDDQVSMATAVSLGEFHDFFLIDNDNNRRWGTSVTRYYQARTVARSGETNYFSAWTPATPVSGTTLAPGSSNTDLQARVDTFAANVQRLHLLPGAVDLSALSQAVSVLSQQISVLSQQTSTLSQAISVVSNAASNALSVANAASNAASVVSQAVSVLSQAVSVAQAALSVRIDTQSQAVSVLSQQVSALSQKLSGLSVIAGNLNISGVLSVGGGQIVFPAVANPSANVNTLDDYEEGTWTPVLTFTTPGDLTIVYSTQAGTYTKVGREVRLTGNIVTSTFTHTTASGQIRITGAPFTPAATTDFVHVGTVFWGGITKASYTMVFIAVVPSDTTVYLYASGSGQAVASVDAADMPTGGSVVIRFTVIYHL